MTRFWIIAWRSTTLLQRLVFWITDRAYEDEGFRAHIEAGAARHMALLEKTNES
jgi:hypothetical protein